jgi:hypothetical protein
MTLHRSPLFVVAAFTVAVSAQATDFKTQVFPILNQKCAECHSAAKKVKGKFDIGKPEDFAKHVSAGKPDVSGIVLNVTAPADDEDVMPPKGKNMMTPAEVGLLKAWIQEGASFEAGGAAPAAPAPTAGGAMTWTNTAGKALQAEFDRLEGDMVVIKTADGTFYKVPLAGLSAESQAQAKKAGGQ